MRGEMVSRILIYLALLVVVVIVIWSFFLVGSPAFNRKLAADRNRIEDLQQLRADINRFSDEQQMLPKNLNDLNKLRYGFRDAVVDPLTGKLYEYKVDGPYSYELCADFDLTSKQATLEQSSYSEEEKVWLHNAGRQCFKFALPKPKNKDQS